MKKIKVLIGVSSVVFALLCGSSYKKVIMKILYKPPYKIYHLLR